LRQHKPFLTLRMTEFVLRLHASSRLADVVAHGLVTAREREIIQPLAEDKSNKEAASTLGISATTIEAHRANIMRKLYLRSVTRVRSAQTELFRCRAGGPCNAERS
jgi:DNA-binding NarL/FixJ family response regulator